MKRAPLSEATDEHLIAQSREGDRAAFGELIARYQVQVYHYSRRLLGNHDAAQDITQDVFIKAFMALNTWQPTAAFAAWLLRIARNACLDLLRGRQRFPSDNLDDHIEQLASRTPSAEQQVMQAQQMEQLEQAILKLSLEHREVVILRDIEGFCYQQLADILDINTGTVRSRLSRARAALMQQLNKGASYD